MQYQAEMPGLKDSQFDQEKFAQPVLEEEDLGKKQYNRVVYELEDKELSSRK